MLNFLVEFETKKRKYRNSLKFAKFFQGRGMSYPDPALHTHLLTHTTHTHA